MLIFSCCFNQYFFFAFLFGWYWGSMLGKHPISKSHPQLFFCAFWQSDVSRWESWYADCFSPAVGSCCSLFFQTLFHYLFLSLLILRLPLCVCWYIWWYPTVLWDTAHCSSFFSDSVTIFSTDLFLCFLIPLPVQICQTLLGKFSFVILFNSKICFFLIIYWQ